MSPAFTKNNLFRAVRPKAETKADITSENARAITEAENTLRADKTARLRLTRQQWEANDAAQPPKKAPAKKAPKKPV